MCQLETPEGPVRIREVTGEPGLDAVRELFREYAEGLGVDLTFQGFQKELATLPGVYAAPGGGLFLAEAGALAAGTVGFRPFAPGLCELKRLYVRPEFRGAGAGRALVEAALASAIARGYGEMVLDTLPSMAGALALYRRLGFRDIPPFYENPISGTRFLGLRLGG